VVFCDCLVAWHSERIELTQTGCSGIIKNVQTGKPPVMGMS
jgi:hypothetical protein